MKFEKFLKVIILFFLVAQGLESHALNYSSTSIQIYNSAVALQKQQKYDLAEQKYYQVLKIQPDFWQAKKNLAILYYNQANTFYMQNNYDKAIAFAQKAKSFNSKDLNAYYILAQAYSDKGDLNNAIVSYEKLLIIFPKESIARSSLSSLYLKTNQPEKVIAVNNKLLAENPKDTESMHSLARTYLETQQYEQASNLYSKILYLKPNDSVAAQNLQYANYHKKEQVLTDSLNNINAAHICPNSLYRLIKPANGVTPQTVEKMKTILDLIWSEPSGRIILQAINNKRVPLKINQGAIAANLTQNTQQHTIYIYGFIPITSYTITSMEVNLPFNFVVDFYNPKLPSYKRIYYLQVFIHEFAHTYTSIMIPNSTDSIEEELGVTMIGYNIAHKVLTGEYLDKVQTQEYSQGSFEALL